jgi:integrase/recombinase XerC
MPLLPSTPLQVALNDYLADIGNARSQHTYLAYRRATRAFLRAVTEAKLAAPETPVENFSIEWFRAFLNYLQRKAKGQSLLSPATESLYLTSLLGFIEDYLYAVLPRSTLSEIRVFANRKRRKVPSRQPPFHQAAIEKLLAAVQEAAQGPFEDDEKRLSVLRDRALLVALADSGLRVFEACGLRRSQLNSPEGRVNIIGKGDKEAQVRLSSRALRAVRTYLEARAMIDGAQKKELGTLPLFARHDWASRGKTLPMTTRSAERVIDRWVKAILGPDAVGTITPHTFRHYFVTVVIRGSGGDFQVAQKLARHANIATTQRYAHISDEALDRAYDGIFTPKPKPSS